MKERVNEKILRIIIPVLALADGVIHLLLNFVLFGGGGSRSGPPPGAPPGGGFPPGGGGPPPGGGGSPFILPLNELFLLNFGGEVVLVLLFWFGRRGLGARRWLVNAVMIGYAAATFVAWWMFGRPNPMGLGFYPKASKSS